jgi:hypothetical protein
MKQIDPERLQSILNEHEAETTLLRLLVHALLDTHPNRAAVLQRFQTQAEFFGANYPAGTDSEFVVELRARLQIHLAALKRT